MKARFTLETSFFGIDKASPVLKRAFSAKRIWLSAPWQQKQARFNPDATDRKSSLAGVRDRAPEISAEQPLLASRYRRSSWQRDWLRRARSHPDVCRPSSVHFGRWNCGL